MQTSHRDRCGSAVPALCIALLLIPGVAQALTAEYNILPNGTAYQGSVEIRNADRYSFTETGFLGERIPVQVSGVTLSGDCPPPSCNFSFSDRFTITFPKGNYTVMIHASCVPEETNIIDNTASNWVFVTILGDVDGDFNVDIIDVVKIAVAYGASSEDPRYTLLVDLNCDGRITILDIVLCTGHYGETHP